MDTQDNTSENTMTEANDRYVTLAANIVTAFVGSPNNRVDPATIPDMIGNFHSALMKLGQPPVAETPTKQEPFCSVRKSLANPDFIICLEDGAQLKMLKRYLRKQFNMSPDEYRAKWGLAKDYPMVAANYSESRREMAKKIGLGTKRTRATTGKTEDGEAGTASETKAAPKRQRKAAPKSEATPAPRRGRKKAEAAPAEANA